MAERPKLTRDQLLRYFHEDAEELDVGSFSRASTRNVAEHFGVSTAEAFRALSKLAETEPGFERSKLGRSGFRAGSYEGKKLKSGFQTWETDLRTLAPPGSAAPPPKEKPPEPPKAKEAPAAPKPVLDELELFYAKRANFWPKTATAEETHAFLASIGRPRAPLIAPTPEESARARAAGIREPIGSKAFQKFVQADRERQGVAAAPAPAPAPAPPAPRVTAADAKVEVKGDPREIIRLARHQALSLADRVGAREVDRIMREAASELDARLRSSIATGASTPTSQREMATTLAQLNDVVRTVSKRLGASAVAIAADAANSAAASTFDYLQSMESRNARRALPVREASMFSRAVNGAESSILNRLATAEQPSVQWSKSARSKKQGDVLVSVGADRLNELWSRDDGFIAPGEIGKRREGIVSQLRKTPELDASEVVFDPVQGRLVVGADGRHRLATLRDSGAERVAVAVSPDTLDEFLRASGGYIAGEQVALPVPVSLAGDDFTPTPGGVLSRYSNAVIDEFEGVLRRGMLTGKPWGDVRDELTSKSPFLQGAPKSWAERIVRTETMGAYNRAGWEAIRAADDELGDMVKILSATFDDRTGWDSYQVHGQIRRPDEAFAWKGGLYQSPPNRPNDREVVVPHRVAWPIPDELAWRGDGEVAAAWKRDRRKGAPPPRPLMTTIPLSRFGQEGRRKGEKERGGPEGAAAAAEAV